MLLRILGLLCLLTTPLSALSAQEISHAVNRTELQKALPGGTLKQLENTPEIFMEHMAGLILGYGGPQGLDNAGVANYLAVNRAYIRAREMRRFLVADLNNDGKVTLAEMNILIQTENARARGRLLVGFYAADANSDGAVDMTESRAFAETRAAGSITQNDANLLEALVSLDLNGDGFLALDEIIDIVSAFQAEV